MERLRAPLPSLFVPLYSFLLATATRLVQSLQLYSETHGLPHLVGEKSAGVGPARPGTSRWEVAS